MTIARHINTSAVPCHRAREDVWATTEVLHHLLERAGELGIDDLEALFDLARTSPRHDLAKLRLFSRLPRAAGVLLGIGTTGGVEYAVGSDDVRGTGHRLFSRDDVATRRMLRSISRVEYVATAERLLLEAVVRALWLVAEHLPPYNPESRTLIAGLRFLRTIDGRPSLTRSASRATGSWGPVTIHEGKRLVDALSRSGPLDTETVAALERSRRDAEALRIAGRLVLGLDGPASVVIEGGLLALDDRPEPSAGSIADHLETAAIARWLRAQGRWPFEPDEDNSADRAELGWAERASGDPLVELSR